jgi:hypothetical protein
MAKLSDLVTAEEMANEAGISAKRFRAALRQDKDIKWHERFSRWIVPLPSNEHNDMLRVLRTIEKREISGRGDAARAKNP